GMTVAHELMDSELRICVLESGKLKPTKQGDRLRNLHSKGIHIKSYSRERVLGGASSTWSGLSSLLDPIDMAERAFVSNSGWPITRDELLPYYDQAARRYRFPPVSLFGDQGLAPIKEKGDLQPVWKDVEDKIFLAAAVPQHFGDEYRYIFDRPEIDGYLDATLLRLKSAGDRKIRAGEVRTSGGRSFRLEARAFVLATGGIENARILLNSCDLCPQGLGNEHDQVGRYMMNHPKNYYGTIRLTHPLRELPYYFGCLYRGFAGYAGLRLQERLQKEKGCLNAYIRFEPLFPWSDNRGVEALVFIAKKSKGLLKSWMHGKKGKIVPLRDYSETGDDSDLQNERKSFFEWVGLFFVILFNFFPVTQYLFFRLIKKGGPRIRTVRLRNFMEMEPYQENRVVLGEEKDDYGQPMPIVRHRCSDLDKRSLIALHRALMKEVEDNGMGRLFTHLDQENPWPIDLDASHHLGTTRMGTDPRTSVVNPDARLHHVDNVFMAGGSVFPTSGCANPTFTIVALAIRLAEHLKKDLSPELKKESAPSPR
ncbi:MAG: GMC family oxidoreductase, partial [Planctomycetes bacterium]|nr:GMC family oxidoreductase [Planctomycetota bacterium]